MKIDLELIPSGWLKSYWTLGWYVGGVLDMSGPFYNNGKNKVYDYGIIIPTVQCEFCFFRIVL